MIMNDYMVVLTR